MCVCRLIFLSRDILTAFPPVIALEAHGFFSNETVAEKTGIGLVNIDDINRVWEEHNDTNFASSFPEFERLATVRESLTQWCSNFDQTLTSDNLSLQERCNRLERLKISRPKGVVVRPTPDTISLWLKVFSWPLNVHSKVELLTEQYESWKSSNQAVFDDERDAELMILLKSNMGSLIGEGHIFLLAGNLSSNVARLRDEAIAFICGSNTNNASLTMNKLVNSTFHANAGLNHLFEVNVDTNVGSSLVILRVLFWKVMVRGFLRRVDNAESDADKEVLYDVIDLRNAKALLLLCPRNTNCESDIIQGKSDEMRLQSMVKEADELQGRASAILLHTSEMLREHGVARKNELSMSLDGLKSLQADFNSNPNVSSMLKSSIVEDKVSRKVKALQWLLKSMEYPILWGDDAHESGNVAEEDRRISLSSLTDLHSAIPLTSQPETTDVDAEVSRMISHAKNLVDSVRKWQDSFQALVQSDETRKIIDLSTIKAIAQASILSMVSWNTTFRV